MRPPISRWAVLLLALGILGAVLTARRLESLRPASQRVETSLLASPRAVHYMSLGHDGLAAGIYWTRAVQYFGRKHLEQAAAYALLEPLLNVTVTLDPKFTVAYEFGSFFLAQKPPQGAGDPDAAVRLVERGIAANPGHWRLYSSLGFIHYIERKDPLAAADTMERGARVPGSHPWMGIMAATMRQKGGDAATARQLWMHIYESTGDELIKRNALYRLASLQVDEEVIRLEQHVAAFQRAVGAVPLSWKQMVEAGWLRGIPRDPSGLPYRLTREGRALVQEPRRFPFITRGLPEGESSPEVITPDAVKPKL
jgi:hypothetical protein